MSAAICSAIPKVSRGPRYFFDPECTVPGSNIAIDAPKYLKMMSRPISRKYIVRPSYNPAFRYNYVRRISGSFLTAKIDLGNLVTACAKFCSRSSGMVDGLAAHIAFYKIHADLDTFTAIFITISHIGHMSNTSWECLSMRYYLDGTQLLILLFWSFQDAAEPMSNGNTSGTHIPHWCSVA